VPASAVHVIDPEQLISLSLAALLGTYGITVERYTDIEAFNQFARAREPHGCLLLELAEDDDLTCLQRLHDEHPGLPIVVMAENAQGALANSARKAGAADLIERSLVAAYLFNRLSSMLPGIDALPRTETSTMEIEGGEQVTFRMARPDDARIQQEFVAALSDKSKYMRFFSGMKKLPDHVVKAFTTPRFPISYAVVATVSESGKEKQIGVARWAPTGTEGVAEFAVVVADEYQGRGIASRLMRLLIAAAAVGGLQRLEGLILKENEPMLAMVRKMGFTVCPNHNAGPSIELYVKELRSAAVSVGRGDDHA